MLNLASYISVFCQRKKMFKLNHPYNINEVVATMANNYSSQRTNHSQIFLQYIDLMSNGIVEGIMYANQDQLDLNQCPIDWVSIRRTLPRYNNQQYWLDWLHTNYPLVTIHQKGSNLQGLRTMITPLHNPSWQEDVEHLLTPQELFEYYFHDVQDHDVIIWSPIDRRSLEAYIEANKEIDKDTHSQSYNSKLRNNLRHASKILKILDWADACRKIDLSLPQGIPQRAKESVYGRQYLTGVNLQTASKEVRIAALGNCYEYDIECSVFSWKLDLVKHIDPSFSAPATLEMIDRKDAVRRNLAERIFPEAKYNNYRVKNIKEAITAIGFGARRTAGSWPVGFNSDGSVKFANTSLRDIIKEKERLNAFLQDPWVVEFMNEQTQMTQLIYNRVRGAGGIPNADFLKNTKGATSKNKLMAYLYQHSERELLVEMVEQNASNQILLMCHDAFYTKHPVKLAELRMLVRDFNSYANIKETAHRGWTFDPGRDAHKALMRRLEAEANGGIIPDYIQSNYNRIERLQKSQAEYGAADEYDNGYRPEARYDPELDPFWDKE